MPTDTAGPSRAPAILRAYMRAIETFAGTLMAIILIIMVTQVGARYLFNASLIWAEELCRYLLIWLTFALLGPAFSRGHFVALDILPFMLGRKARLALKIATVIPLLIFLVVIVINGWDYASRFERQVIPAVDFIWTSLFGHNIGLTVRWVYICVPIGCTLLALHVVADVVLDVISIRRGDPDPARPDHGEPA